MLGKAIWRFTIQENPYRRPGLCPGPRSGSLRRSRKPLVGGRGWLFPRREPHTHSPPFGPRLSYPTPKLVPTLLVTLSGKQLCSYYQHFCHFYKILTSRGGFNGRPLVQWPTRPLEGWALEAPGPRGPGRLNFGLQLQSPGCNLNWIYDLFKLKTSTLIRLSVLSEFW